MAHDSESAARVKLDFSSRETSSIPCFLEHQGPSLRFPRNTHCLRFVVDVSHENSLLASFHWNSLGRAVQFFGSLARRSEANGGDPTEHRVLSIRNASREPKPRLASAAFERGYRPRAARHVRIIDVEGFAHD